MIIFKLGNTASNFGGLYVYSPIGYNRFGKVTGRFKVAFSVFAQHSKSVKTDVPNSFWITNYLHLSFCNTISADRNDNCRLK